MANTTDLPSPAPATAPAEAVTALYRAHALGLIRLAVVMLGDRPAAEDVVQEAFCGLYRRWHITPDGSAVICGAQRMIRLKAGAKPVREQGFFEFSTRTGRVTGIQGAWEPSSTPYREVLWSNPSGRVIIGVVDHHGTGVIRGKEFTPLTGLGAPFPADTAAW